MSTQAPPPPTTATAPLEIATQDITTAPDSPTTPSSPPHRIPHRPTGRVLIPPPNFGMVEDQLYRSGQPSELNFPFLEKLKLKSIVWLAPEETSSRFLSFLDDHSITLHHLGVENAVNYDPITEEVVLQALDIIINPANLPLMIMCNLGRHRTGTVVGIFRKLQRWNLASILEEYRRYAGPKVRVLNEQFIELFDCDLVSVPLPS